MFRKLGVRVDPRESWRSPVPLDLNLRASAARRTYAPNDILDPSSAFIRDQGGDSSCTGHGTTNALRGYLLRIGEDPGELSPDAPYTWGRYLDGDAWERARDGSKVLRVDDGARVTSVLDALVRYGAPKASKWPAGTGRINVVPPLGVAVDASGRRVSVAGWQRLPNVDTMREAIARRWAPVCTLQCDNGFLLDEGDEFVSAITGPTVGHHLVEVRGWVTTGVRGIVRDGLLIANSWGRRWRNGGLAVLSRELVESQRFGAAFAMTGVVTTS